jgi:predicted RNA polymerase sigma factor
VRGGHPALLDSLPAQDETEMDEFHDDRLNLIFTCCRPSLAMEE